MWQQQFANLPSSCADQEIFPSTWLPNRPRLTPLGALSQKRAGRGRTWERVLLLERKQAGDRAWLIFPSFAEVKVAELKTGRRGGGVKRKIYFCGRSCYFKIRGGKFYAASETRESTMQGIIQKQLA